jgi:hypothetical protein
MPAGSAWTQGDLPNRREPEIEHFVMAITSAEATIRQLLPAKINEQKMMNRGGSCYG